MRELSARELDRLAAGLDLMFTEAPKGWWRFMPCGVCNAYRGEECVKGGAAWPEKLGRPHVSRYRAGLDLHGCLWLIRMGYGADVLGADADSEPLAAPYSAQESVSRVSGPDSDGAGVQ